MDIAAAARRSAVARDAGHSHSLALVERLPITIDVEAEAKERAVLRWRADLPRAV